MIKFENAPPPPASVRILRDYPIAVGGVRPAVGDVVTVPETTARVLIAERCAEAAR